MELIGLVKRRKVKEAIKQVEEGASLNESDENGYTALHYACSEGLLDFIIAAAQHGVNFEQRDKEGESALFKAVKYSKMESIVAMVAFKSKVNGKNNNQQSPLEIAVKKKDVAVIELLCSVGSHVTINDWALSGVDVDVLNKTDQKIMQTLINQSERATGNEYGNHDFRVCYVSVIHEEHFTVSTDITLYMNNIYNGFFMYCSKSIPEYTNYEMHIGPDDCMFSDVYEVKTWGHTPKYVRLNIAVLGCVKQNQEVSVMSFEGSVEGAMLSREVLTLEDDDHAEEYTKFDVKIDLTRMKLAKFVVLVHLRHEEYDVSHESLKIIPQSESGAEINIPEGTFDSPGKLILNIADTNYWNTGEMVLFSNALNIKMQSNIKPKKPVNIKLPLHSSTIQPDDLFIISSDKDIPETENDWEICSTNINIQGNKVTFDAEHFTSFAPVSRTKIRQSKKVLTKAVAQYKPTEIFAGIKREGDNKLTLVVEIALKNRGKQRRKHWKKKGFGLQTNQYRECVIQNGEKLKISVEGNFEIDSIRKSGGKQLIFNPDKKSFRTFNIVSGGHESPKGYILITRAARKIVQHSEEETSKTKCKPGCFNIFYKNVVEAAAPRKVTIENATEELVNLPINQQCSYDNADEIKKDEDIDVIKDVDDDIKDVESIKTKEDVSLDIPGVVNNDIYDQQYDNADDEEIQEGDDRVIIKNADDDIKDVESINVDIDRHKEDISLGIPRVVNDDIYDFQCDNADDDEIQEGDDIVLIKDVDDDDKDMGSINVDIDNPKEDVCFDIPEVVNDEICDSQCDNADGEEIQEGDDIVLIKDVDDDDKDIGSINVDIDNPKKDVSLNIPEVVNDEICDSQYDSADDEEIQEVKDRVVTEDIVDDIKDVESIKHKEDVSMDIPDVVNDDVYDLQYDNADDEEIQEVNDREVTEDVVDDIKDDESIKPKEDVSMDIPDVVNDDVYDPQCTIPVLKKSSLFRLGKQLNVEECFKLGEQLNISEKKLLNIRSKKDLKKAFFEIWRPVRPNETLVSRLVQALTMINKREEAEAVQNAFAENIEFRP